MENGLGGTNTIVYRPSTAYDNKGGDAQPDLPFITWVVDKTRQNDGQCTPPAAPDVFQPAPLRRAIRASTRATRSSRRSSTRTAASMPVEREFRGLRRVVRTSVEGSGNPGNQTVTYFGQDNVIKGRILQADTYAGSSALVRSEVNLWGTRSAWSQSHPDLAGGEPPQPLGSAHQRLAPLQHYGQRSPRCYGNVSHTTARSLRHAARRYVPSYALPPVGRDGLRPSGQRPRVTDAAGVLEEKWFYHDGNGAAGLPYGGVYRGSVTSASAVRLTPSNSQWVPRRRACSYDAYGNLLNGGPMQRSGSPRLTLRWARSPLSGDRAQSAQPHHHHRRSIIAGASRPSNTPTRTTP
jgi:hypothetical protein